MRHMPVKEQQEQDAAEESGHRRQKRQTSQIRGRFMDGIRSDHTDAATMTPAAKAQKTFFHILTDSFFIKYTHAAPSVVPANGS